jgi:hypothetical protein
MSVSEGQKEEIHYYPYSSIAWWSDVADRLPEDDTTVLVYLEDETLALANYEGDTQDGEFVVFSCFDKDHADRKVLYWTEVPLIPACCGLIRGKHPYSLLKELVNRT